MKKIITLLFSAFLLTSLTGAQNLVTNPGFENDPSTFTVVENTTNVLMRVAALQDATTQTTSPTAIATTVSAGMWVKKAANSGYVKGVVVTTDFHSGTSCLNLKINSNTTQTGLNFWYNCVNLQKLTTGLNATKKYIASVWARADDTSGNQCNQLVLFVTDGVLKTNYTKTISLTGGTTWTQYQTTFDLPTWVTNNPTADFTNSYFGVGITTNYDSNSKTLYSGILMDDFSLTEDTSTGLSSQAQTSLVTVQNGNVIINGLNGNQQVNIYNIAGSRVFSQMVNDSRISVPLSKGIYIVNVNSKNTKVIID